MNVTSRALRGVGRFAFRLLGPAACCLMVIGCARLPVPVQVIHEDQGLLIRTERVSDAGDYSHPIVLNAEDIARILRGLSVRERPPSWPLRLFGKAAGQERLFDEDEIHAIAPRLSDGLQAAKPNERVAFALYAPGPNPDYERVVTSGWLAIRHSFFHIAVEDVKSLQPRSPTRNYYPFYPELPPAPPAHDVMFQPQEFWGVDPVDGHSAVQFRDYLRSVSSQPGGG